MLKLIFASRNRMAVILWERPQTGLVTPAEPVGYSFQGFPFLLAPAAAYPAFELINAGH